MLSVPSHKLFAASRLCCSSGAYSIVQLGRGLHTKPQQGQHSVCYAMQCYAVGAVWTAADKDEGKCW